MIKANFDKEIKAILENAGVQEVLITDEIKNLIKKALDNMKIDVTQLDSYHEDYDSISGITWDNDWNEDEEWEEKVRKFIEGCKATPGEWIEYVDASDKLMNWFMSLDDDQVHQLDKEVIDYVESIPY